MAAPLVPPCLPRALFYLNSPLFFILKTAVNLLKPPLYYNLERKILTATTTVFLLCRRTVFTNIYSKNLYRLAPFDSNLNLLLENAPLPSKSQPVFHKQDDYRIDYLVLYQSNYRLLGEPKGQGNI